MASRTSFLAARLLWAFPALLALLAANQAAVTMELRETVRSGVLAKAEVLALSTTDRADITMASVRLRAPQADGAPTEHTLPLPITFARALEGRDSLDVYLARGASQEVVIAEIGRAQWRLAGINGLVALFGALLLSWGVYAWNRHLRTQGDPADAAALPG